MTICPRCRAPHDAQRTREVPGDPLLLTGGARWCSSCAQLAVEVSTLEVLAGTRTPRHGLAA